MEGNINLYQKTNHLIQINNSYLKLKKKKVIKIIRRKLKKQMNQ